MESWGEGELAGSYLSWKQVKHAEKDLKEKRTTRTAFVLSGSLLCPCLHFCASFHDESTSLGYTTVALHKLWCYNSFIYLQTSATV